MTQLEKAREEIRAWQDLEARQYPYGRCPRCGRALDYDGECPKTTYVNPINSPNPALSTYGRIVTPSSPQTALK